MIFKMKRGTKVGWLLVAAAILLSLWVIISQTVSADIQEGDFSLNDAGTDIISYNGTGGMVTVPDTVTFIPAGLFEGNSSLTGVVLPPSCTSIGNNAFRNCTNLGSVRIQGSVREIPAGCFEGCTSLSSVTIPGSVQTIGSRAFANCVSLETAPIENSVSTIMPDAFDGCFSLAKFVVGDGNTEYVTINNCLYDITMTKLIMVPAGETDVKFAETCTVIGTGAFSQNQAVSSIVVPNSVTTIEAGAFSGSAIASASIPASVKTIGSQSGWSPLTIYGYAGTAAENFAYNNGITFVLLGNTPSENTETYSPAPERDDTLVVPPVTEPGTEVPQQEQPAPEAATETQPQSQPQSQPSVQQPSGSGSSGAASAGTGTVAAASGSTGKDPTPKTADGDIDARWFLIVGIFMVGVAVILYSRIRKFEYVTRKRESDLDS